MAAVGLAHEAVNARPGDFSVRTAQPRIATDGRTGGRIPTIYDWAPVSMLTPEQLAYLTRLRSSGYLHTVESLAMKMTAPLRWHAPAPASDRLAGGTVCVIDTGSAILGITAAHVHRKFERLQAEAPDRWCQLGGHTFNPVDSLIAIHDGHDLATFRLSPLVAAAARVEIHRPATWPPADGDGVFHVVGGWPSELSHSAEGTLHQDFLHFIVPLAQQTSTKIGLEINRKSSVCWGDRPLPEDVNIGGLSGGPIYRLNEKGLSPPLTLVGIVSDITAEQDLLFGPRMSLVSPSGEIIDAA